VKQSEKIFIWESKSNVHTQFKSKMAIKKSESWGAEWIRGSCPLSGQAFLILVGGGEQSLFWLKKKSRDGRENPESWADDERGEQGLMNKKSECQMVIKNEWKLDRDVNLNHGSESLQGRHHSLGESSWAVVTKCTLQGRAFWIEIKSGCDFESRCEQALDWNQKVQVEQSRGVEVFF
jgi:hypothetical protein